MIRLFTKPKKSSLFILLSSLSIISHCAFARLGVFCGSCGRGLVEGDANLVCDLSILCASDDCGAVIRSCGREYVGRAHICTPCGATYPQNNGCRQTIHQPDDQLCSTCALCSNCGERMIPCGVQGNLRCGKAVRCSAQYCAEQVDTCNQRFHGPAYKCMRCGQITPTQNRCHMDHKSPDLLCDGCDDSFEGQIRRAEASSGRRPR
ncbi:hypothetical protein O181_083060 [Austropuccinia psidii MF-1]|uniref:TNFR-Cys domain-containing protein n=1 Tax=Austropuccinia psidii MF-1 TaxID=1389203 RepID=A0A9Q3FME6_9BASI|nr:hypothetical protein [Austropuccinia psidii MF-1]